ncbi:MAG: serine/threonine-protein kinase [Fuerstiella sp.]
MSENSSSEESESRLPQANPAAKPLRESAASSAASRLRRVAPSQKESKLARISKARRANTGPVKHPRDLLGVSLADGRYIVKSPLGKGSMAYVFRASDARLQTDVVLKVPKPEKVNTADFRERFHRESQMLIRFSHPHVVKVLDVGEYAELPYVVMQLLEGGSLSDRIARESDDNGCMSPESLKTWIREVARALDFCYRKGMVHRDVKPANILFDEDKNAYVGDFGLSKIMGGEHSEMSSDETAAGVVLGTPNYISPEVVQGKDYDGRSDQYSLGITIYHVLTGGPPMQGNTATMTMMNQTQKVLPLLSEVRDDIPRPLAVAVRKAIEKDPDRRFNTCVEFAEAVIEGLRFAPLISTSSQSSSSITTSSASSRKQRVQPALQSNAKSARATPASADSSTGHGVRKQRKAVPPRPNLQVKKKVSVQDKARRGDSNRAAANKSSRLSQRQVASSSSSALDADLDWFDMDQSGGYSSGHASSASSRASSRSSSRSSGRRRAVPAKSKDSKLINVFGQQLHPAVLVGLAVFTVFSLVMTVWSPWGADEISPELVTGQYHPKSQNSAIGHPSKAPASESQKQLPTEESRQQKVSAAELKDVSSSDQSVADGRVEKPNDSGVQTDSSSALADFLDAQSASPLFDFPAGTLTGFGDGTAEVFVSGRSVRSRQTGEQIAMLSGDYAFDGVSTLSVDGKWFAATTTDKTDRDYKVRVWNTKTGRIQLEVDGDGRRTLRNLFLSDKYLYLETDRAHLLQAWNLTSRRQQGVLTLPADRFRSQRMGMTREGSAFAALVGSQFSIINGVSGVVTTKLDSPLPVPVQVAMANSSVPIGRENSTAMLHSLSGIQFSNDQLQLAAVRKSPKSALMAWGESGNLQYDLPFAVAAKNCQPVAVQWFEKRSAWLVNGSVIDAKHRRVVVAVPHRDDQGALVALRDDDSLLTTIRSDTSNVYHRQIPWTFIDDSLAAMADDGAAFLKPGGHVQLAIEIEDGNGSEVVLKTILENAIQQRLADEQISVSQESRLQLKLTNRAGLQDGKVTVLELIDAQTSRLIWYSVVGESIGPDSNDFETQRAVADTIAERISRIAIPYYIPSESSRLMLPYFINE